jgi:hypothetical protein
MSASEIRRREAMAKVDIGVRNGSPSLVVDGEVGQVDLAEKRRTSYLEIRSTCLTASKRAIPNGRAHGYQAPTPYFRLLQDSTARHERHAKQFHALNQWKTAC